MLTAVFAMRFVRGFDEQILEALKNSDPEIHSEAVQAAGTWALDAAWPHIVTIVNHPDTDKALLLAAIEAVGSIRPAEAPGILMEVADSDDEDIADAVEETIAMAQGELGLDDEEDEEEEDEDWVN